MNSFSEKKGNKIQELIKTQNFFEKELVSNIWFDKKKAIIASARVRPEDMRSYKAHYETILDCYLNSKNLTFEFQSKNLEYSDILEPSYRGIEDICRDLIEAINSVRLFATLESAASNVPATNTKGFASDVQKALIKSVSSSNREDKDITGLISEYKEKQEFYIEKFKSGKGIIGIPTGYTKLDEAIDGLRPEHLWIIGGYTNQGKTFAALNIAANLVKQGKRVVVYSLEMGRIDILSRLVGVICEENGLTILKGYPHDVNKVNDAFKQIESSGFSIHSDIFEVSELQFSMQEEMINRHVDLFIIDFMQLIRVKGTDREYETLTAASLTLQQAAKVLQAPIIVLSQISNESAKSSDPVVMGFKGSGSIASAADLAIEIQIGEDDKKDWKIKMFNGEEVKMKWNIRKNRHGKTGYLDMLFLGRTGVFKDANKAADEELAVYTKQISLPHKDDDISADEIDL